MTTSSWRAALPLVIGASLAIAVAHHARAGGRDQRTTISIQLASGYGGVDRDDDDAARPAAGFVTQRREVDVGADGLVRLVGVAATLDPDTVEFRSVTDPTGTRVVEQRLNNDLLSSDALVARQLGKPITVTLTTGAVAGTLRAVTADALVVETPDHAVTIVPRGANLIGITLPAAAVDPAPTLEWRVATAKPGRHTIEASYRAAGLAWQPDYAAVIGDDGTVELAAWASITNQTGVDFDGVELTLTDPGVVPDARTASPNPPRAWRVPGPVDLHADQTVKVELAPRQRAAKARPVLVFEGLIDGASAANVAPTSDCDAYVPQNPRLDAFLEVDVGGPLPDGRVRVLRRSGGEPTAVGEGQLRTSSAAKVARIPTSDPATATLAGERSQVQCIPDAGGRSLREELKISIDNDGAAAAEVVVREYMYRWSRWKIVRESAKGQRVDDRAQEYRLRIPPGKSQAVTFTVQYDW
ncbi:MAG: hypothetical protein R3B06_11285 [Kofleriaceae bacterium]